MPPREPTNHGRYTVYEQRKPKHIQNTDDWSANLKQVGTVWAESFEDAIAQAKIKRLARWPVVSELGAMQ